MDSRVLYTILVGAVVVERLAETEISRRHTAWSRARGGVEHGQEHFGTMITLHVVFLAGCLLEPWVASRPFVPALGWPALALTLGAQAVRWWCVAALGPRWNVRIIAIPGEPLVSTGPYRWMRHPNYLAVLVEGMALPLVHSAWVTAVGFTAANVVLLRQRIRVEEAALRPVAAGVQWGRAGS